ncbi:zinc finger protein 236 [Drosophila eugracilis]|uniref:zinc finger protein 236 n=1 Tax=Drosophila eugracilis TaxID=29029 RepID=UPI001BD9BFE9|nr:zinc finger protein 236 [Drosophila eugracilis]
MEGMDLWTSMFSSDFEEGEPEAEPEGSEQYGNGNDDFIGDSEILEAGDAIDDLLEGEDDEREEEEYEDSPKATKKPDPDDDALFDFDTEPIVSIAEPNNSVLAPAGPMGHRVRPPTQRQSVPGALGRPRIGPGLSVRPTTSQINATDENGVPINYELGVVYICPACGGEFRQQDHWKRHMNHIHKYNTLRGLNFTPLDKLYQRCKECNKRIAMHSRENLLKHKFTHLPFRCTKCYFCKREYKYRQDLMVHLRLVHCDEVVAMMRGGYNAAGRKTRVRESRTEQLQREKSFRENNDFEEEEDRIEVRNELLEPDADEVGLLEQPLVEEVSKKKVSRNRGAAELCEDYIHYMCPDCGTECDTHAQWSQHIEFVHDYVSRRGLNFRSVDMQMQCLECKKIVIPNTIKSLRSHKFSHLSQPEWLRCKLCYRGFTDHQEVIRHLLQQHHMDSLMSEEIEDEDGDGSLSIMQQEESVEDNGNGEGSGAPLDEDSPYFEDAPRRGGRISSDDMFEPHIDYLCPQCGKEFIEKKHWRTHVVMAHSMNDLTKLNFEMINERQLKCTECEKIITNAYGIQNAQQHRITHLPFKAYARCRKCNKSYTDRKGLVKHLATYHGVGWPKRSAGEVGVPASLPTPIKQPRKQIVTVANETYEIIYLDDVDQGEMEEDNDFGEQMQADEEDYLIAPAPAPPPPPPPPPPSQGPHQRYKCVHCGTLFPTQAAVRVHISEKRCRKTVGRRSRQAVNSAGLDPSVPTVEQNYIFLCPSCGMEYKTQFEWRRHINEVHNFDKRQYLNMKQLDKYRYQCTQCKDIVCNSKLKGLQDHHFRHLPYRLYLKCLICGTCYNHKPNIAAHLRARHSIYDREAPAMITKPKQVFGRHKDNSSKEKPRLSSPPPAPPSPPACSSSSASSVASRSLKPQPGGLPTRPAGLNTLEDSISYHNAVDLDFITYFCPKCNQNFDSHAFWRKHIVEQHNFNSREGLNFRQIDNHHYLCLECYKRVTVTHTKGAIGQLQSHKFRHLPHRSFKCLTCDGEFVRKQMFFKHLNRDTNRCDNRPHRDLEDDDAEQETQLQSIFHLACPQCGDNFTTRNKTQWREHINDYHGLAKLDLLHMSKVDDNLYRCQDCDEELQTNRQWVLQFHRFQHLPHAAYIRCKLCKQSNEAGAASAGELHSLRELQQHLRKHHPTVGENEMILLREQIVLEEKEQEEGGELPADEESQADQDSGPYMPLPPHLLDDGDDIEFEDQYLLG